MALLRLCLSYSVYVSCTVLYEFIPRSRSSRAMSQCPSVWIKVLEDNHHHLEKARGLPEQVLLVHRFFLPDTISYEDLRIRTGMRSIEERITITVLVMAWTCLSHATLLSFRNNTTVDTSGKQKQRATERGMEVDR